MPRTRPKPSRDQQIRVPRNVPSSDVDDGSPASKFTPRFICSAAGHEYFRLKESGGKHGMFGRLKWDAAGLPELAAADLSTFGDKSTTLEESNQMSRDTDESISN
ncbi:hypothetical protein FB45DRAFT_878519 [Roridomyces roridus]|uniref:Uncharacterized protein n=1 Tax=Roridomyces roridus TaxID=1738132 RepID=A0AAD7B0C3_9AGAR|nr:hypothetical protein FB45DRAFT_878519 [Roridomyces roridus]